MSDSAARVPSGTHKRTPYINHPIRVATLLARAGIEDIDILGAAILHDTVEDTDTTPDDLRRKFGETITNIVLEVTDDKSLSKAERRLLQIQHAPQLSDAAALVKLADKVDNIGTSSKNQTGRRCGLKILIETSQWTDESHQTEE